MESLSILHPGNIKTMMFFLVHQKLVSDNIIINNNNNQLQPVSDSNRSRFKSIFSTVYHNVLMPRFTKSIKL